MPKQIIRDIHDFIEPDTDTDNANAFNLNLKQINFIRNDNNIHVINNVMKLMKTYNLQTDDLKKSIEDYQKNEIKKQERNELRRLKRNDQKNIIDDSSDDGNTISNKNSNKKNNKINKGKRSNSRKR